MTSNKTVNCNGCVVDLDEDDLQILECLAKARQQQKVPFARELYRDYVSKCCPDLKEKGMVRKLVCLEKADLCSRYHSQIELLNDRPKARWLISKKGLAALSVEKADISLDKSAS